MGKQYEPGLFVPDNSTDIARRARLQVLEEIAAACAAEDRTRGRSAFNWKMIITNFEIRESLK